MSRSHGNLHEFVRIGRSRASFGGQHRPPFLCHHINRKNSLFVIVLVWYKILQLLLVFYFIYLFIYSFMYLFILSVVFYRFSLFQSYCDF